jgi:hypothetical protein
LRYVRSAVFVRRRYGDVHQALNEQYRLEEKNYASIIEELGLTRQQRDDAVKALGALRTREAELEGELERQKEEVR